MKITLARPDLRAIRWPNGIEDEGGPPRSLSLRERVREARVRGASLTSKS
jgi:hypothetical protein